jgi:hypothetical protein
VPRVVLVTRAAAARREAPVKLASCASWTPSGQQQQGRRVFVFGDDRAGAAPARPRVDWRLARIVVEPARRRRMGRRAVERPLMPAAGGQLE